MTNSSIKPPVWFWIVSVVALIWNGLGVDGYLGQAFKTERWKAYYTEEQLQIIDNYPAWLTAAFAIAVFSAVIGCIGLLLRKKWSNKLFILSLIAVIAQMGYIIIQGYADNIEMAIMIVVFAIFLVWFSKFSISKGWIS